MAEYIEREAVLSEIDKAFKLFEEHDDIIRLFSDVRSCAIYANAVDAVPVVRCKDCKYHHDCNTHFCDALGMDCPDDLDFFCSYGKRKEGAE